MNDTLPQPEKRKLLEVALPLAVINRESAREKSIRSGHPSTLHQWWSRKPLATARAVLFAQLVDDPSSHPDRFPTDADVTIERKRLHDLLERLVVWENSSDERLFRQAHQEILDSTDGCPPQILDPFAGGGSIPLEAQRLGLDTHASDLNPVAVLLNKALIEIPPAFFESKPVNPELAGIRAGSWPKSSGLAEDVRYYGRWIHEEAERRIGKNYPRATLTDGTTAPVVAWIWARTVACPNPACGISMPLASSWWLGKKKGKEAWVVPASVNGRMTYRIGRHPETGPQAENDGTVGRSGARCVGCGAAVDLKYIRAQGRAGRMSADLIAIAAEGRRTRHYLDPSEEHLAAANVDRPTNAPEGSLPLEAIGFRVQAYGFMQYSDLFTSRQLVALTTFSDLVSEVHERVRQDFISANSPNAETNHPNRYASAYADAISTYLGLAVSRLASTNSSFCRWNAAPSKESVTDTFSLQALPMIWDFAEGNVWTKGPCSLASSVGWVAKAIDSLGGIGRLPGSVTQENAVRAPQGRQLISTDPPYYDYIGYSDLSDYFYVWLRRSLREVHPDLLSTLLVPKAEELVANPYRHGGKSGANEFFRAGFDEVFRRARSTALSNYPITVYYAFKQSEITSRGEASTGWETLLEGMVNSGWSITATWPMRSERGGRMRDNSSNALASSIVLALRPRPDSAPRTTRRGFVASLKAELPAALREMQQGAIAPVDLPQAAIGPGMAVFSRYATVLNDDGTSMRVRDALTLINEVLDEVLSEQEGDFDAVTRFALAWFRQHGFDAGEFGNADNLARARNASLEHLERAGILSLRGTRGKVTLLAPASLDSSWDPATDTSISTWEVVMHLSRTLTNDGITAASALLSKVPELIDRDLCKELAFLLFALAEDAKRAKVAVEFNALGTAWNDIAAGVDLTAAQGAFDYMED